MGRSTLVSLTAHAGRLAFGLNQAIIGSRLSILIFHRVLAQPDPMLSGDVDAARFEHLMRLVAHSFRVITLGEALAHLTRGRLPRRSLVITFDDGYADNARVALPILRRHGLRATFFVSTGFLDGGRMWNDTVIEALRRATAPAVDLSRYGLGILPLKSIDDRCAAMDLLLPRIKYLGLDERVQAIAALLRDLAPTALPDELMMTSDQVRELRATGMEIGAHTVNHPILAALAADEAMREIADGRDQLSAIVGEPIKVMAYPNGVPGRDFNAEHVQMLQRLGFEGAVTTAPGVARVGDDLFQLPRFSPWDRSLWRWTARLLLNQWKADFASVPVGAPHAPQARLGAPSA